MKGAGNIMKNNNDFDLESELAKSIAQIVDDEVETATGYVSKSDRPNQAAYDELEDLSKYRPVRKKKKNTKELAIVLGIVASLVVIVVAAMIIIDGNRKNSYSYNVDKGTSYYTQGDYSKAVTYYSKAISCKNADVAEVGMYLYYAYKAMGQEAVGIQYVTAVLQADEYNKEAVAVLARYYSATNNSEKLAELINKYAGTGISDVLSEYLVKAPSVSVPAGSYKGSVDVELTAAPGCTIYYTIDGTKPSVTAAGDLYTEPVRIGKGTTTLYVMAVDSYGICSDIEEYVYQVQYVAPDNPVITPASGSYTEDMQIVLENYTEDIRAYYTLDGSIPDEESFEYTEPIDMPEGNNIFTVIYYNRDGITSSIAKRNYNLKTEAKYTFEDAVYLLKARMIEAGDLASNGKTNNGSDVKFTYYAKRTIDGITMYLISYDIKINGSYVRQDFMYGFDVKDGYFYTVIQEGNSYIVTEY